MSPSSSNCSYAAPTPDWASQDLRSRDRESLLLRAAFVACVLGAVFYVRWRSLPPAPDSAPTTITEENYHKIELGMSPRGVIAILGEPWPTPAESGWPFGVAETAWVTWKDPLAPDRWIQVQFQPDVPHDLFHGHTRVIDKRQSGFCR